MVGICLKLEKTPKRGVSNFLQCLQWSLERLPHVSPQALIFPQEEASKDDGPHLMSVDREGRERYTSDHARAGEVGKCQLSLHLHRFTRLWKTRKGRCRCRAEMRTFLPLLPLESYHSGQLASSWAVSLHNWPIRRGEFLTISPSYALHMWAINEWMVGGLFCCLFFFFRVIQSCSIITSIRSRSCLTF